MYTYLFFPLPNDEAVALRWQSERSFEDVEKELDDDIAVYTELMQSQRHAVFCARHFPHGLPVLGNILTMHLSLNQGPKEAQPNIFLDSLDLDNPKSIGASGYGFYAADIRENSAGIRYRHDKNDFLISCELQDDGGRTERLSCNVPLAFFKQGLKSLYMKTVK